MAQVIKDRKPAKKTNWRLVLSTNVPLFLMCIPCIVLIICFCYMPMAGTVLAFKNFKPKYGIFGSPWVGFKNFEFMFKNETFWAVLKNTLFYNIIFLVIGRTLPPILAIITSEVHNKKLARVYQTTMIMPHFLSYVVVSVIVLAILGADTGIMGHWYRSRGLEPIAFYSEPNYWYAILIIVRTWKTIGYDSIIYLGTITGISDEYYEAAVIDGANHVQQVWHITLPGIMQIIGIMFIMAVGGLLNAGYDQILLLQQPANTQISQVLDTYVLQTGIKYGKFEYATAIGLFKSLFSLVMVVVTNYLAQRFGEVGLW